MLLSGYVTHQLASRTGSPVADDVGKSASDQCSLHLMVCLRVLFQVHLKRIKLVQVAAHYQHLTLMAARRAAAKARSKRHRKDGKEAQQDGQVRAQVLSRALSMSSSFLL